MSTQKPSNPFESYSEIHVPIPEEMEYLVTEAAKHLQITPDELVRQAVAFYCREVKGGSHE
jgi:hypothetical protein